MRRTRLFLVALICWLGAFKRQPMRIFYATFMVAGVICSVILGGLFLSKYNWSLAAWAEYAVLLFFIEFGCFAYRDWKHYFGD